MSFFLFATIAKYFPLCFSTITQEIATQNAARISVVLEATTCASRVSDRQVKIAEWSLIEHGPKPKLNIISLSAYVAEIEMKITTTSATTTTTTAKKEAKSKNR